MGRSRFNSMGVRLNFFSFALGTCRLLGNHPGLVSTTPFTTTYGRSTGCPPPIGYRNSRLHSELQRLHTCPCQCNRSPTHARNKTCSCRLSSGNAHACTSTKLQLKLKVTNHTLKSHPQLLHLRVHPRQLWSGELSDSRK